MRSLSRVIKASDYGFAVQDFPARFRQETPEEALRYLRPEPPEDPPEREAGEDPAGREPGPEKAAPERDAGAEAPEAPEAEPAEAAGEAAEVPEQEPRGTAGEEPREQPARQPQPEMPDLAQLRRSIGREVRKEAEERYRTVLEQAFRKAKQIVDTAQNYRTAQIRECARQTAAEREEAKKRGYQEGFAKGREEGRQQGLEAGRREGGAEGLRKAAADNRKNLDELARMIEAVERSKTQILSDFGADLKDLALTIAKAVVKKELETDPKTIRSIILNAMDGYRNQAWLRIYVSDGTAKLLLKADSKIAKELKAISDNIKVIATSGMDDGGCVLETPDRVIDAGTDTQLKRIKSALDEAVRAGALAAPDP